MKLTQKIIIFYNLHSDNNKELIAKEIAQTLIKENLKKDFEKDFKLLNLNLGNY